MKRLISLIVIGGLALSLCACDKEEPDRSSQTENETEVEETTESETDPVETSEVTEAEITESETEESETSETTTSEETTISETDNETEAIKKEGGNIFIDCSGKSADQIVANVVAIRTLKSGDTAESYAERFDIAPQEDNSYEDLVFSVGYNWDSEMVGSNDLFSMVGLDVDFDPESGEFILGTNSNADIFIELSDLDTAKEVFDKVNYILAVDYVKDDDGNYDEEDVLDLMEYDDSDTAQWESRYLVRSVSLQLKPNNQGTYQIHIEIDLLSA